MFDNVWPFVGSALPVGIDVQVESIDSISEVNMVRPRWQSQRCPPPLISEPGRSVLLWYPGLHHDAVPEALLAGRPPGLPLQQQQEPHLWCPPGQEDLGSWRVLRPLEALLHPWHHHGEHYAEGLSWWQHPVQCQVRNTFRALFISSFLIKPMTVWNHLINQKPEIGICLYTLSVILHHIQFAHRCWQYGIDTDSCLHTSMTCIQGIIV